MRRVTTKRKPFGIWVDIKKLNDQEAVDAILKSSSNAEIYVDLQKLKNDPDTFIKVLSSNIDDIVNLNSMSKLLKMYTKDIRTVELDKIISNKVCSYVENLKPKARYKLGKEVPIALRECTGLLDEEAKSKILSLILDKNKSFYTYAKKDLAGVAIDLSKNDDDLASILNTFYKVLEKEEFLKIINNITDRIDNNKNKKILKKTKRFNVCRYSKAEVKNDADRRVKLLKDIARTPSSIKNMDFKIAFTLKDLENLASIQRFNLLKWYFNGKFNCAAYNYNRPNQYDSQISNYDSIDKISLPNFSESELVNLLFSVSLKKYDEVTLFVNRYKVFKKFRSGMALTKKERKNFNYYYPNYI